MYKSKSTTSTLLLLSPPVSSSPWSRAYLRVGDTAWTREERWHQWVLGCCCPPHHSPWSEASSHVCPPAAICCCLPTLWLRPDHHRQSLGALKWNWELLKGFSEFSGLSVQGNFLPKSVIAFYSLYLEGRVGACPIWGVKKLSGFSIRGRFQLHLLPSDQLSNKLTPLQHYRWFTETVSCWKKQEIDNAG